MDSSQPIDGGDSHEDFNLFATILTDLDDKKQRRSHENVIAAFTNHNIDPIKADAIINTALEQNFVYSYKYSKKN